MKNLMMIYIVISFAVLQSSSLMADIKHSGKDTRTVTAYYCDDLESEADCLRFKGSGPIWLLIFGELNTITIEIPVDGIVPQPDPGGEEINDFFLFTNQPSTSTGKGYINGCLHYYGEEEEFRVYEIDEQTIYEDYNIWEQNAQ